MSLFTFLFPSFSLLSFILVHLLHVTGFTSTASVPLPLKLTNFFLLLFFLPFLFLLCLQNLYVSSNATDTDFTVKLTDVYPNGTSMLIQDGILRMRWRDSNTTATYVHFLSFLPPCLYLSLLKLMMFHL